MSNQPQWGSRGAGPGSDALAALEVHAAGLDLSPGWITRERPIMWSEPRSEFVPAHWRYEDARAALGVAAGLIDLSLADRRILALRNPHPGNNFATTRTLSCAYQLMLPGETASTHRHAPHALRIMLDAKGTYSIVDGVRMPMETGDIVLTPGGSWHGHGHEGDQPASWLDGLDIPLTHLLEPMFFEPYPDRFQPATQSIETSPFRYAASDIARKLDAAATGPEGGDSRRIVLPTPGMTTIGLAVARLGAGERTRRRRSTANRCCVVMQGEGRTLVGDTSFSWSHGDAVAIPAWTWFEHHAMVDAQVCELSDEPLMRWCNYYRHEAG